MHKTQKQKSKCKETKIIFWCVVIVTLGALFTVANTGKTVIGIKNRINSESSTNDFQTMQQQTGVYSNVGKTR